ncbi:ribonucleoside triphosphate reductase [Fusibacter sp. JL216-2]|uniref:ribonucleoside triphosphate reductase n=1 Tax=Fusibacter sp. JL216-2 TaxID=3071453 RepID=UPI003D340FAB
MLGKVEKRNGAVVDFDRMKVEDAIFKALVATHDSKSRKNLRKLAEVATDYTIDNLTEVCNNHITPKVEDIQDGVEVVLMKMGEYETAKKYIKYRYEHKRMRETKKTAMDIMGIFDEYIGQSDWTVRENSNMSYSLQGLNNHVIAKATKTFWLNTVYDESIRESHENGDMHIHDLGLLSTYCCGWSLEDLLMNGFAGVSGKVESSPAKHFEAALMQLVNFIYTLQGEAAGAQAVSNFDTLLAPFVHFDNLDYKKVKQIMQTFVFNMNIATRVGFQTPFFNVTMDKEVPSTHKELPVIIGGKRMFDHTYKEFQKEMDMINLAFCEVMMEGDARGRVFTFPIPTYNITSDWDWNSEVTDKIMEMTGKFGIPYFSNFVNSDLDPEDVRSMCCRLRLDNTELRRRGGGLFGANPKTGSIGVVTINLARLGYTSDTLEALFDRLERLMEIAKNSLETKRTILEENMHRGLYPYSKHYLHDVFEANGEYWHNHFATIGPNGLNECIANFTKGTEDITTPAGKEFAEEVLDFMNEVLIRFQEETGHLYNLEASPAEGTAHRFAKRDLELYPDIVVAGDESPYYTNSSQLPVGFTEDIFDALDHQDSLQVRYTGGTVFHGFIPERIESIETLKKLIQGVSSGYRLPYFTITPTFSICPTHKYIAGEEPICPECGAQTEVWTRVVGYHRPVQNWNDGKQSEFSDRLEFEVS